MKAWTDKDKDYLRKHYADTDNEILSKKLGASQGAIRSKANLLGLKKESRLNRYKKLSEGEISLLQKEYPKGDLKALAETLCISITVLYQKANTYGVKRDEDFLLEQNRKLARILGSVDNGKRFKKGEPAFNKGKKQVEFMAPEAIERTKLTRFPKGNRPHNYKPIGYERVSKDGYTEIKVRDADVSKDNFELKQRIVYEKHFGVIPEGHIVEFKDGNKQNFDIENLALVSRADNVRNNGMCDTAILKRHLKVRDPGEIQEYIENHSDLIEMKRNQLKVNGKLREIKSAARPEGNKL